MAQTAVGVQTRYNEQTEILQKALLQLDYWPKNTPTKGVMGKVTNAAMEKYIHAHAADLSSNSGTSSVLAHILGNFTESDIRQLSRSLSSSSARKTLTASITHQNHDNSSHSQQTSTGDLKQKTLPPHTPPNTIKTSRDMTTISAKAGDTFESIAITAYKECGYGYLLQQYNKKGNARLLQPQEEVKVPPITELQKLIPHYPIKPGEYYITTRGDSIKSIRDALLQNGLKNEVVEQLQKTGNTNPSNRDINNAAQALVWHAYQKAVERTGREKPTIFKEHLLPNISITLPGNSAKRAELTERAEKLVPQAQQAAFRDTLDQLPLTAVQSIIPSEGANKNPPKPEGWLSNIYNFFSGSSPATPEQSFADTALNNSPLRNESEIEKWITDNRAFVDLLTTASETVATNAGGAISTMVGGNPAYGKFMVDLLIQMGRVQTGTQTNEEAIINLALNATGDVISDEITNKIKALDKGKSMKFLNKAKDQLFSKGSIDLNTIMQEL